MGTDSSNGANQNAVVARMVTSVASPAGARRPSSSHAISIRPTPVHSRIDESTSPWPNRSQDMCMDSSNGSCVLVLPAPNPPTVMSTEAVKPSFAGFASGVPAKAARLERCSLTDRFVDDEPVVCGCVGAVIGSGGPVRGHLGQFGQPRFGCRVDGRSGQRGQRALGQRSDALFGGGEGTDRFDDATKLVDLQVGQLGADRAA